jgi:hypothetical protein
VIAKTGEKEWACRFASEAGHRERVFFKCVESVTTRVDCRGEAGF